jgi:hypothetical protein
MALLHVIVFAMGASDAVLFGRQEKPMLLAIDGAGTHDKPGAA